LSGILLYLMAFISELNDGTVLLHDSESSYNHVEFLANRMIATIYTIASILRHPKKKKTNFRVIQQSNYKYN
jgi:primosomal protein N''